MKRVVQWFKGLSRKGKAATIVAVFFVLTGAIGSLGGNKPSSNVQESGLVEVKNDNSVVKDKIQQIDEQKAAKEQIEQKQAEEAQPAQTTTPQTTAPAQTPTQPKATSKPAVTPAPVMQAPAQTPAAETPTQTKQPAAATTPAPAPQEQPAAVAPPPPPAPPASTGSYIGNKNSKKFHLPSCGTLPDPENWISFDSRDAAIADGYVPCKNCNP